MINVTDCTNINMRFYTFKLFSCHYKIEMIFLIVNSLYAFGEIRKQTFSNGNVQKLCLLQPFDEFAHVFFIALPLSFEASINSLANLNDILLPERVFADSLIQRKEIFVPR